MKHETTHSSAETPAKGFSPGFAALGLEAALLTTLDTLGYEEPTPIQREAIPTQLYAVRLGVYVVVATPGRALDHIHRKTLQLKTIQMVVLDEADEMLDMGFAEDLDAILEQTPKERQTALFSATMPLRIASIAKRYLKEPVEIKIAKEPLKAGAAPRVHQTAYIVARQHKVAALARILDMEAPKSALVFFRPRIRSDELPPLLT